MTEKLQLSKSDRQKFGGVQPSCKVLGTMNGMQNLGWAYSLIPAIKNSTQRKKTKRLLLRTS